MPAIDVGENSPPINWPILLAIGGGGLAVIWLFGRIQSSQPVYNVGVPVNVATALGDIQYELLRQRGTAMELWTQLFQGLSGAFANIDTRFRNLADQLTRAQAELLDAVNANRNISSEQFAAIRTRFGELFQTLDSMRTAILNAGTANTEQITQLLGQLSTSSQVALDNLMRELQALRAEGQLTEQNLSQLIQRYAQQLEAAFREGLSQLGSQTQQPPNQQPPIDNSAYYLSATNDILGGLGATIQMTIDIMRGTPNSQQLARLVDQLGRITQRMQELRARLLPGAVPGM